MSKKRNPVQRVEDDGRDKPDYAADLFRPQKQKKPAEEKKEDSLTLRDVLGDSVTEKLARLKESMAQTAPNPPGPLGKQKAPRMPLGKQPTKQAPVDESGRELSFAELFDPVEEDDKSFSDMLKDSKLDWTKFK